MAQKQLHILDEILSVGSEWMADRFDSFDKWRKVYFRKMSAIENPADMAVAGGFYADRVAYGFAAGYHAALKKLVPDLPKETVVSFCVTEEGGGHPRMIKSRLEQEEIGGALKWKLNGRKQFVTCAAEAELLLVAASKGLSEDGKNRIRIVLLEKETQGVTIELMKELPFVPEISHGIIHMKDVLAEDSQILPGDGYTTYIRPFRTIEDLHVNAAVLGYLFRIAKQFKWPEITQEQILSLIVTTKTLAECESSLPQVHISLGGLLTQTKQLISSIDPLWEMVDPEIQKTWKRDSALMNIAEKARTKRLETAWSQYKE